MNVALSKSWDPLAALLGSDSSDEGDDAYGEEPGEACKSGNSRKDSKTAANDNEKRKGDSSSSSVDWKSLRALGYSSPTVKIGPSPDQLQEQAKERNVSLYFFTRFIFVDVFIVCVSKFPISWVAIVSLQVKRKAEKAVQEEEQELQTHIKYVARANIHMTHTTMHAYTHKHTHIHTHTHTHTHTRTHTHTHTHTGRQRVL
jgi:hypothetical protein